MDFVLIRLFNVIIGLICLLPSHTIDLDLTPLTSFLPFLNYFIPLYLISPILEIWFNALGLIFVGMVCFRFYRKHL